MALICEDNIQEILSYLDTSFRPTLSKEMQRRYRLNELNLYLDWTQSFEPFIKPLMPRINEGLLVRIHATRGRADSYDNFLYLKDSLEISTKVNFTLNPLDFHDKYSKQICGIMIFKISNDSYLDKLNEQVS